MGDKTAIEWTATVNPDGSVTPGSTWNPVTGCDKVSPGCAHCYAETVALRFWPKQYPPVLDASLRLTTLPAEGDPLRAREFTDLQMHADRLDQPLHWKKPRRIFVNSMSDLFHEAVPDAFIDQVFAVMAVSPQHTYQALTKRAERLRDYMADRYRLMEVTRHIHARLGDEAARAISPIPWPLPNVWLGVSVENQRFADERIPLLLQTPAAIRFISAEPLLGEVTLAAWLPHAAIYIPAEQSPSGKTQMRCIRCGRLTAGMERECRTFNMEPLLDWVIVGGESGAGARPFDLAWARSIVQQCQAAGVACFVKQIGSQAIEGERPYMEFTIGQRRVSTRDRKGGDPSKWPADLRVRQFPETSVQHG